jgi:hypothetical protein
MISVGTVDIGVRLLDLALRACRGGQGRDAIITCASTCACDGRIAFAHYRMFHGVHDVHEPVHVAYIDPMIPARRRRAAGQDVNIGILAADEQDSFSRLDAGVNFGRQHIPDEGIAQRDQVHIGSKKKSRQIVQRNQARSVNGHATRAKLAFDVIDLRARSIQPEPEAIL